MHFQQPIYFYLFVALGLLVLLFVLYLFHKKKVRKKLGDIALINDLTQNYLHTGFVFKNVLLLLGFGILIVCVANLQQPDASSSNITRKGIDVLFALDVSNSMLSSDIQPNRLERAKNLILKIQEANNNNKYGLMLFAGNAYMQMPLSTDMASFKLVTNAASVNSVPMQGTQITNALQLASTAFTNKELKYKTVVLISDGENHEASANKMAAQLRDSGVTVNTIGIGSVDGINIIDPITKDFKKDNNGINIISKLNETILKEIALATNGKYFLYTNTDDVVKGVSKEFSQMGTKVISDKSFSNYTSFYKWFGIVAGILLITQFFIPLQKRFVPKLIKV
jgi:Ca-activated chloride channel homolog